MPSLLQTARLLQTCDSLFPTGAFSYSEGLETAVTLGEVNGCNDVQAWMDHFLEQAFAPMESRAYLQARKHVEAGSWELLKELDQEYWASKPAKELREGSVVLGKRYLKSLELVLSDPRVEQMQTIVAQEQTPGTLTVCQALGSLVMGHDASMSLLALGYQKLSGIVSAGMRLGVIGQIQGQRLLTERLQSLTERIPTLLENAHLPLESFSPRMDFLQLHHSQLHTRLFRS